MFQRNELPNWNSVIPSMSRLEYNWLEKIRKRIWNVWRHHQKNSSAVPNSSQSDSMEAWSSLIWGFAMGWNPASSLRILSISWRYSLFSRPDNPGESEQLSSSGYSAFCITTEKKETFNIPVINIPVLQCNWQNHLNLSNLTFSLIVSPFL